MKCALVIVITFLFAHCSSTNHVYLSTATATAQRMTGSAFYKLAATANWRQRDSLAMHEILSGNIPSFLKKLVAVRTEIRDSLGYVHYAIFRVTPDYLAAGTDDDWARIPLTPMAAQQIADSFQCFLPTKKMVDLIYQQAIVKLAPVPMYAFRDSSVTMWQHHLIIEGQRKGRKGLIAGIKKDVVITEKLQDGKKSDRVAIYGWHQLNGVPIQPLYTGHINWYVDYSHGIRLVYKKIVVDGKELDYKQVLKDPFYKKLLSDEENLIFFSY